MRSSDKPKIKNHSYSLLRLENPILFDYYINKSLYPQSKPKARMVNEEGFKQFTALCLGLLLTPILIFS